MLTKNAKRPIKIANKEIFLNSFKFGSFLKNKSIAIIRSIISHIKTRKR
jgi:hypothetical protein